MQAKLRRRKQDGTGDLVLSLTFRADLRSDPTMFNLHLVGEACAQSSRQDIQRHLHRGQVGSRLLRLSFRWGWRSSESVL